MGVVAGGRLHFLFILLLCLTINSYTSAQERSFTRFDSLRGTLNKYRACFDVKYYGLHLKIDIARKSISGFNQIAFTTLSSTDTIQLDLFKNLSIDSILFQNKTLSYYRDSNHVIVLLPKILKQTEVSLLFYYHGAPVVAKSPPWDGGFVWTTDSLKRPWVAVACEGIGASSWWPLKDHLSDEPDSVNLYFDVPTGLYCVSNGTFVKETPKNNGFTEFHWRVHYPINSYNITLNIGNYTHFQDQFKSNDTLMLDYFVLDQHEAVAKKHFSQVQKVLSCFTKRFGPYPFPKDGYALVETPYWGMEHQGAIAYGNHFKNDLYDFDFIIVHETAHEWWGNSLSVSDHADMWIHEAFATYSESILLEDTYGPKLALEYLKFQKTKIKNKQPMQGPQGVNYNEWPDTDMYYKGSWMLHTLRNSLHNDSLWFALLQHLNKKFFVRSVSTASIIQEVNEFTGKDWTGFFNGYLNCTDIPSLEYYFGEKKNKNLVYFRWNSCAKTFQMPLKIINNGKEFKIHPTTDWQSATVPIGIAPEVFVDENNYFIRLHKIEGR